MNSLSTAKTGPVFTHLFPELDKALSEQVLPTLRKHRGDTDRNRRLSDEGIRALCDSGLMRMGADAQSGGINENPVALLKLLTRLSSEEASAGWITWNSHLACIFARFLSDESRETVFANPTNIYANSLRPEANAWRLDGGYRFDGRWTLLSSSYYSDWFALRCVVQTDGEELKRPGPGVPLICGFVHKDQIRIEDTWHASGLRGTASNDIVLEDVFVPDSMIFNLDNEILACDTYSQLPIGCINASGNAAICLGILQGCIDEICDLCSPTANGSGGSGLRFRARVQGSMAKAQAVFGSGQSYLHECISTLWDEYVANQEIRPETISELWSASCHVAEETRQTVTNLHAAVGTYALYESSRIERAHRDIHAVTQHGTVQPHWFDQSGMMMFGIEPSMPMMLK